jgi:uncharacterized membrane protein (Fun14 family)
MWSNYSDAIIFISVITVFWLVTRGVISMKAKAFNEGFKRGRASLNVREILK